MTKLRLFLGDSDQDIIIKHMLDNWVINKPEISLEYLSIHTNPAAIVRLGITDLPALVLREEIIAQGSPEHWLLPLLDRVFITNLSK